MEKQRLGDPMIAHREKGGRRADLANRAVPDIVAGASTTFRSVDTVVWSVQGSEWLPVYRPLAGLFRNI